MIEWTESMFSKQLLKTLFQFYRNRYVFNCNPLKNVFIFLRRIAKCTSRNYIFYFGISVLGNRYNMVKCCGKRIAISASSLEFYQNLNLNLRLNWLAFTFAAVSVLLSFAAVNLVIQIHKSCIFGFVGFAKSVFRHRFGFEPLLTFTTPTQTFLTHQSPFTNSNIIGFWFVIAIVAFTFQSIKTRTVFSERRYGFPLLTNRAFFQTCFNPLQILRNGNSSFLCRTFNCTVFSLSHITRRFSLFNFSTGGLIR